MADDLCDAVSRRFEVEKDVLVDDAEIDGERILLLARSRAFSAGA